MAKITKISGKCQYEGCESEATHIAYDYYEDDVSVYCRTHAEMVRDRTSPEYEVDCPNCGCLHGV